MRGCLLACTALTTLAAGGVAHAQWDVSVGGFHRQWFGYGGNNDDLRLQSFDQWSNSEIYFRGRNVLDNGITFGFHVELEANTVGDQIDESYLYIQSADLGRFQLGSENSAGYQLQVVGPETGLPINTGSQTQHVANPTSSGLFRTPFGSTLIEPAGDNDGQKITYFTPRYEGFQFGISYLPDIDPTGGDTNALVVDDTVGRYGQGVSAGLNFERSFGPVDVALSGSVFWAEGPNGQFDFTDAYGFNAGAGEGITRSLGEDFWAWSTGASVSWAGFTVGGSYAKVEEGRLTTVNTAPSTVAGVSSDEGNGWEVGVAYETGPWQFGVEYYQGVASGVLNIPDNNFHQSVSAGVRYDLADGVTLVGSVGAVEFAAEGDNLRRGGTPTPNIGGSTSVIRGNNGVDDNSGVFVTGGVLLSF
ncbi:MAG: porin [Rhodospirillaceae bacterium]|nr:porin [Rhodospirillaceae bacterium]